ncbi:hypothetical protein [Georgenia sp. SUBG003]|uniref:hypothetical protein n=1 Tax=Georgenia sp. SUBG003 TaxID=1497974 RepID=UPI003AB4585B
MVVLMVPFCSADVLKIECAPSAVPPADRENIASFFSRVMLCSAMRVAWGDEVVVAGDVGRLRGDRGVVEEPVVALGLEDS